MVKKILLVITVAVAALILLRTSSKPQAIGKIELQQADVQDPMREVLRGSVIRSSFRLINRTGKELRIHQVSTGCGCAILGTEDVKLVGELIPSNGILSVGLTVDTSAKTGRTIIPLEITAIDATGLTYRARASFETQVNPGWAVSRGRLTLNCESSGMGEIIFDELILFQTSAFLPFQVERVSISNPLIDVTVSELPPGFQTEKVVVVGGNSNWPIVPRYSVRALAKQSDLKMRQRETLAIYMSHRGQAAKIDVDVIPRRAPIVVVPDVLRLNALGTNEILTELIITSDAESDSLQLDFPKGVSVKNRTPLAKNVLRLELVIALDEYEGTNLVISDGSGNQAKVKTSRMD